MQCGCPCEYGRLNGLDATFFYKQHCFGELIFKKWKNFKYFSCFIEKSCDTGIIYSGDLSSINTVITYEVTNITASKLKIEKIETPTIIFDENSNLTPSKPENDFAKRNRNNGIFDLNNFFSINYGKFLGNDEILR